MSDFDAGRRRVLRIGAAAASCLVTRPIGPAWAQSDPALKLLRAPKVALVIGNSNYKSVPALRNPGNDAQAISDVLTALGFAVTVKLDADRAGMIAAIAAYGNVLARQQCVGLFYYAGHGVQLAWRNFLIPNDARVTRTEDIDNQCVDVTVLVDSIRQAANPMNVIILDACRDNPFGSDFRTQSKGLSQMDAPAATLLAYATAPGHVASDGEGSNGLYTENLLREIKVPETRIEDVFKRVRLSVRHRTNGEQIPWESTSLEDDFYFIPPVALKKRSDEEEERELQVQLARWEKIKDLRNVDEFYLFLQEYPSGLISEQAQFRLDQLQRPKVLAEPGENGVKPLPSGANRYAVGDEFTREFIDHTSKQSRRFVQRVTYADDDRVEFGNGFICDQMGNVIRNRFGTKAPAIVKIPADISLGKRWRTAFTNTRPDRVVETNFWEFHVVALEDIRVPAGSFKAFRIEGKGDARFPGGMTIHSQTYWVDPTTMVEVRADLVQRDRSFWIKEDSSTQLVNVTRAPR